MSVHQSETTARPEVHRPPKERTTTAHSSGTVVLGIETSCDETAAAVVVDGSVVASSVVSSQVERHKPFGGVVPEIAGRAHIELVGPVIEQALSEAGFDARGHRAPSVGLWGQAPGAGSPGLVGLTSGVDAASLERVDAVAVTTGPGLVGSLLVGVSTAKALALAWRVPFVGVNHLEAHLFAAILDQPVIEYPLLVLLVSGGHTMLLSMKAPGVYRLDGQTLDDAAGEAFDKVSRFIGLGYPGGPALQRAAVTGDPQAIAFPRSMIHDGLDFSFSGLKTSVVNYVRKNLDARVEDIAASFQEAVVDVLVAKAVRAVKEGSAKGVCLAGGVAANALLRERVSVACENLGIPSYLPSMSMCTDNAAMVAAAGSWSLEHRGPTPLSAGADPNLSLMLADA